MKIQILGRGCPKCKKTYEIVEQAVRELGITADVEKVEDLETITNLGAMVTPAVAIDGEVRLAGRVPSIDEIKHLLQRGRS